MKAFRVIGFIFTFIGVFMLLGQIHNGMKSLYYEQNKITTSGVVISLDSVKSRLGYGYANDIQYKDEKGHARSFRNGCARNAPICGVAPCFEKGDSLQMEFLPEEALGWFYRQNKIQIMPEESCNGHWGQWLAILVLLFLGFVFRGNFLTKGKSH
jgi:hypothetical protein